MRLYLYRMLIAIDQFLNTLTFGEPDETISSRVGKAAIEGGRCALIAEAVIDWLFKCLTGLPGHCRRVIEWDEA